MQLGQFEPRANITGDELQAKTAVDRPLVVLTREHRLGVVTKFKPEGGAAVVVDVADVTTGEMWLDVLWMNGAVVDNLSPYIAQPVAVKLQWTASAKGGNSYIGVVALEGPHLQAAQQWVATYPDAFDNERARRMAEAQQNQQQQPAAPTPAVPAAPAPAAPAPAAPAPAPAAPAPAAPQQPAAAAPAPAAPAAGQPGAALDPNDPAVQALLAQIQQGQAPPAPQQ